MKQSCCALVGGAPEFVLRAAVILKEHEPCSFCRFSATHLRQKPFAGIGKLGDRHGVPPVVERATGLYRGSEQGVWVHGVYVCVHERGTLCTWCKGNVSVGQVQVSLLSF